MYINEIVKGQSVEFIKGDYEGERGTFKRIIGYTDTYGCVCEIAIGGELKEFTSDFFTFVKPEIQENWEDDTFDFKLEQQGGIKMKDLTGKKWGELTKEKQEQLLQKARAIDGVSTNKPMEAIDCIIDFEDCDFSISGAINSEGDIVISDEEVFYNPIA